MSQSQPEGMSSRARLRLNASLFLGLTILFAVLPFHLVVKELIPGPIGTYWKEGLLGLLVLLWIAQCVQSRRLLLSGTSLDGAVLVYLMLLLVGFALSRTGWTSAPGRTGAWGLYVSVMYLPVFWLVSTALRKRPHRAVWLILLLVAVGGLVALGGLVEFLVGTLLWPSDQVSEQLGYPDVYIRGAHVRRVYSTFDSPTTLANTLALLLPLALSLVLIPAPFSAMAGRKGWNRVRLVAGGSAILMLACVIVTFSQDIWVVTALSFLAMGLLSGFARRKWRPLLAAAGALLVLGMTWGGTAALRSVSVALTNQGIVELSSSAYVAALVQVHEELLRVEPVLGEPIIQDWTLVDPVADREDGRVVLYQHPGPSGQADIVYRVSVPEGGALRFAIALSPEVWSREKGDGTRFRIYVHELGAPYAGGRVFAHYIDPKHRPSDCRWRKYLVDLSPWAGRTVNLHLVTDWGPEGNWAFDWGS